MFYMGAYTMIKNIKSNWAYILWAIVYVGFAWAILGGTPLSLLIVVVIYALSIMIALSPIGEKILRLSEDVRELSTMAEKEYLLPLFEDVYREAKEHNNKLSDKINLYIIDVMYVNAFAMGKHTIAVTRGATTTFSPEQLRGVLAHEFGHISNGDTKALLLNVVGNGIFTITILLFKLVTWCIALFMGAFESVWAKIFIWIFNFSLEIGTMVLMYLGQIILSLNDRKKEYMADEFAYKIGYGEQLISALYLLDKIAIPGKLSLSERLKASHPHTAKRIGHLETLTYTENEPIEDMPDLSELYDYEDTDEEPAPQEAIEE